MDEQTCQQESPARMIALPTDPLLHGDALQILPTLPAESIDLVFADPPYNLQLKKDLWRPNLTLVDNSAKDWDDMGDFAAYDEFTHAWLSALRPLMKRRSSLWVSGTYHNIFRIGRLLQDLGFWLLNTITWYKPNAMPNFSGTRLKNDVEFIIWAQKMEGSSKTFRHHFAKQFNDFRPGKQLGSVWRIPTCGGKERLKDASGRKLHATQKPEELLTRIILSSSRRGDIVLDPFLGTGTTAVVAKRTHRRWLGIEKDPRYLAAAAKRIAGITPLLDNHPLMHEDHRPKRIPFVTLLEAGLLRAGQSLFLDSPAHEATILPDGQLQCGDERGSIHHIGARLKGTPACNGWMHWRYVDARGQWQPLDTLRRKLRDSPDQK